MDLLELTNVTRVIDKNMPDEIYNLAARSFVQVSFEKLLSYRMGKILLARGAGRQRWSISEMRTRNFRRIMNTKYTLRSS